MQDTELNALLSRVEKPARYIGGEYNSIVKEDALVRWALCFPDVYEIGMSHLGARILYHILNALPDTACERVYTPWPDMEKALRDAALPLFTLETKRPLRDCDVIGFSLLYEMCYTNILTVLDLAGLPLRACERGEDDPLVIAGGPCACNPMPVLPFFDAILIGDGEELVAEVSEAVKAAKARGTSRGELLKCLSQMRGVLVPSLRQGADKPVVRRIVDDLNAVPFTGKPLVPFLGIVHDRVALEVMRGCTRGCRFCQAGYIYRPLRERDCDSLLSMAREQIDCTGYDEVSLLSLSTGDYSDVHRLVPEIMADMEQKRVSMSLPSLRVDAKLKEDLRVMQSVRKAGLTFAPEAGTQRLRDVINKNVTEEDVLSAAADAFAAGWSTVKLYFMIGLPTETDEDVLGISTLARKVGALFYAQPKEARGKGLRLTVSVSTFVPKPFTAFQWCAQNPPGEIRRKQALLREALKGARGVQLNCHYSDLSVLEAAFSRGDEKLADVLECAWTLGCRFDSWSEHFQPALWEQAFRENGTAAADYAQRVYAVDEPLPWDGVDMLVTKRYLQMEWDRAMAGTTTKDCRQGCNGCFGKEHANDCRLS